MNFVKRSDKNSVCASRNNGEQATLSNDVVDDLHSRNRISTQPPVSAPHSNAEQTTNGTDSSRIRGAASADSSSASEPGGGASADGFFQRKKKLAKTAGESEMAKFFERKKRSCRLMAKSETELMKFLETKNTGTEPKAFPMPQPVASLPISVRMGYISIVSDGDTGVSPHRMKFEPVKMGPESSTSSGKSKNSHRRSRNKSKKCTKNSDSNRLPNSNVNRIPPSDANNNHLIRRVERAERENFKAIGEITTQSRIDIDRVFSQSQHPLRTISSIKEAPFTREIHSALEMEKVLETYVTQAYAW